MLIYIKLLSIGCWYYKMLTLLLIRLFLHYLKSPSRSNSYIGSRQNFKNVNITLALNLEASVPGLLPFFVKVSNDV